MIQKSAGVKLYQRFKRNIRSLHLFLSADLRAALEYNTTDPAYVFILFLALIISFSALFLSEGHLSHVLFLYLLVPIFFAPFKFKSIKVLNLSVILPNSISLYNIFRNVIHCRTSLFLAFIIYGINKSILSYLYPDHNLGYFNIFFFYLLFPLVIFIMTIVRLSVDFPQFNFLLFRTITPIAATNACINIYNYKIKFGFENILTSRIASSFGSAMGYNANLDGLIYSIFFVGLLSTLYDNLKRIDYITSIPSLLILSTILFLEHSREIIVGIFFGTVAMLFSRQNFKLRHVCFLGILPVLLSIYAHLYLDQGIFYYFNKMDSKRIEIWLRFYTFVRENILFGYGERTVFSVILDNGELHHHPHSLLLSSWLRGGIIGLASMVYMLSIGLIRTYAYARFFKKAIPFSILITVFVSGLTDFELKIWQAGWEWAGYWLVIGLVIGADAALMLQKQKQI